MTRKEVYEVIDSEREYQDKKWRDPNDPTRKNPLHPGEWLLLIDALVQEAKAIWITEAKPNKQTLEHIRKIAGSAVGCLEQHGARKR